MYWTLEEIRLPLKFSWKISRNTTEEKINFYVRCSGKKGFAFPSKLLKNVEAAGEVAPNIRYGESPDLIKEQFGKIDFSGLDAESSYQHLLPLKTFNEWLASQDVCNSLRFGLESAFIHLYCKWNTISIYELLKIQPPDGHSVTAFSLPIMDIAAMKIFYQDFGLERFKIIKVKIGNENAVETIRIVSELTAQPLIIDANEAWTDPENLLLFFESIRDLNILFIEQPLPANLVSEYKYLKTKSPFLLIADESVTDKGDFEALSRQFHGVNMKLMKAGGYQNGLKILQETRKFGLKTMIGCMVETGLGISSALRLSKNVDFLDLDSFLYLQNDPLPMVKEENGLLELVKN